MAWHGPQFNPGVVECSCCPLPASCDVVDGRNYATALDVLSGAMSLVNGTETAATIEVTAAPALAISNLGVKIPGKMRAIFAHEDTVYADWYFGYLDAANHFRFYFDGTSGVIRIAQVSGGVESLVGFTPGFADPSFRAVATAAGTLRVCLDGATLQVSYYNNSSVLVAGYSFTVAELGGRKFGLRWNETTAANSRPAARLNQWEAAAGQGPGATGGDCITCGYNPVTCLSPFCTEEELIDGTANNPDLVVDLGALGTFALDWTPDLELELNPDNLPGVMTQYPYCTWVYLGAATCADPIIVFNWGAAAGYRISFFKRIGTGTNPNRLFEMTTSRRYGAGFGTEGPAPVGVCFPDWTPFIPETLGYSTANWPDWNGQCGTPVENPVFNLP